MKKIILLLACILCSGFSLSGTTFAQSEDTQIKSFNIVTYTTEDIPGANCALVGSVSGIGASKVAARYRCECPFLTCFDSFLKSIYNVTFFITLVVSVLVLVVCGVLVSISGVEQNLRTEAIKWIKRIIFGLVFLSLIPWLLLTIAPWAFK